jgi:para-nitrobenzyl esterase
MKTYFSYIAAVVMLCFISLQVYAQCSGGRYHDMVFPGNPTVISDVVYGSNTDYLGNTVSLKLDVYQPACDNATNRALVVFAHGGSFVTGDKADAGYVQTAVALAKLGYVVASINYRLGFPQNPQDPQSLYGFNSAIIRGLHDGRAAVRFMRNNALNGGNTYGVDPNNIFFGGVSAGGIIALHLAYQNTSGEMNMNCNNQPGTDCSSVEGNSNNLNVSSSVKAIVSISGGIRDLNWITTNDIPCGLFHGTNDGTVPYGSGYFVPQFNLFPVHGSSVIATRCNTTGTTHCFKPMIGQDHIPTNVAYVDTISTIMRNFLEHFACSGVALNCNYTTPPVAVSPSVLVAITAGSNSICTGESVTFTATPSNLPSPTYQWKVNGNNVGTNSPTFTSTTISNNDVVTCVATPNCGSAATSNSITMTVNSAPTISQNGNVLTSSASSGNQWYRDGQIINGATGQTHTATQSGNYTVKVGNCESQGQNVVITGMDNWKNENFFSVYPNPNNGTFHISFHGVATENYKLELRNIIGVSVYEENLNDINGQFSKTIDVSSFGKGIYLIRLSNADMDVLKKIVVY